MRLGGKVKPQKNSKELLLDELKEIGHQLRHYSSLRFAILTVFFAFLGGAVSIGTTLQQQQIQDFYVISVKLGGFLGTLVFWFFEMRIGRNFVRYEIRADEIEKQLGFHVYSGRLNVTIKTPWVTAVLYSAVLIFWILALMFFN